MERIAPAGDVYQAGTLSGNPLAVAAGLRDARAARRGRLHAPRPRRPSALAAGLREAAGDAAGADRPRRPGLLTVFFTDEPVRDYAGAARLRHRGLRRLVPRAARPRRLPAAVAVRGLVPVARPHARARRRARSRPRPRRSPRSHERRSRRSPPPCAGTAAWSRPPLAERDGAPAPPGERAAAARAPPPRPASTRSSSRRSARAALLHYGQGRILRPDDADLALLAGDRLYALGLERLAALGDLDAVAELADLISLVAQAHAEGDAERAAAAWHAGAAAVAAGGSAEHEAAKALARAGEPGAAAALRAAVAAR